jgi:hypothetical protein
MSHNSSYALGLLFDNLILEFTLKNVAVRVALNEKIAMNLKSSVHLNDYTIKAL